MTELSGKSLKRTNVSDQIFEILRDRISSGEWKIGERLPSETELAAAFGVSRMSARAAVQKLTGLGLVDVRVGEGTFVKEYDPGNTFSEMSRLLYSREIMHDMRVFRLDFEGMVMERACQVRTEKDIEALRDIFAEMKTAADSGDRDSFNEADLRFHDCLIEMTRNSVYRIVGSMVKELLKAHYEDSTRRYEQIHSEKEAQDKNYLQGLLEEHYWYLKALEERDKSIIMNRIESSFELYESVDEK